MKVFIKGHYSNQAELVDMLEHDGYSLKNDDGTNLKEFSKEKSTYSIQLRPDGILFESGSDEEGFEIVDDLSCRLIENSRPAKIIEAVAEKLFPCEFILHPTEIKLILPDKFKKYTIPAKH